MVSFPATLSKSANREFSSFSLSFAIIPPYALSFSTSSQLEHSRRSFQKDGGKDGGKDGCRPHYSHRAGHGRNRRLRSSAFSCDTSGLIAGGRFSPIPGWSPTEE